MTKRYDTIFASIRERECCLKFFEEENLRRIFVDKFKRAKADQRNVFFFQNMHSSTLRERNYTNPLIERVTA